MAYVGMALLVLALRRNSIPRGFIAAAAFGLGFFLPHLWWADAAVGAPIGWIALAALQSTAVGLFGAAWVAVRRTRFVARHDLAQVAVVAILWTAVEQLRGRVPFGGFPWGLLAFSQTDAPLMPLAAVGGTTVVSAVTAAIGALLAVGVTRWMGRAPAGRIAIPLLTAVVLTFAPSLLPTPTTAQSGTLVVGAVQGNVPTRGADAASQARAVAANHVGGTRALLRDAAVGALDLVVWPESASDVDPRTDDELASAIDGVARDAGVPILLGTQRFADSVRYNDYLVWTPGSRGADAYSKQRPVPFGEYIPYRDFFRRLSPDVDRVGTDMAAGGETGVLDVPITALGRPVRIATAICFEVAYGDLIRESVVAGGELIIIPTNNASFGLTQESTQQLAMSRFRAVEHGRATVQVSTVGVSAVIAPDGAVLDRTALFTSDQMVEEVPLRTTLTLADLLGAWPGRIIDTLALMLLGTTVFRRFRERGGR
ncbi:apolipoprotein N-acyltransferase [Cellulomonas carbonis]|uniref:Apolipoprotein N-acyltransferase n=2 Tax=Cellulomonas carbonis TaxID=1386092 RepID=A0A0A0BQ31_9CELL|nr:acyltransferase [Cellulomonas carbonis T26]GGC18455.1 apolipoprotein N-acyltransferase [Cellulomonas carbonis]